MLKSNVDNGVMTLMYLNLLRLRENNKCEARRRRRRRRWDKKHLYSRHI